MYGFQKNIQDVQELAENDVMGKSQRIVRSITLIRRGMGMEIGETPVIKNEVLRLNRRGMGMEIGEAPTIKNEVLRLNTRGMGMEIGETPTILQQ